MLWFLIITLSLLIGIAAIWLWVHSYGGYDEWDGSRRHVYMGLVCGEGTLYLTVETNIPQPMPLRHVRQTFEEGGFVPTFNDMHPPCAGLQPNLIPTRAGFGLQHGVDEPCIGETSLAFNVPYIIVAFPNWLVVVVLASLLSLRGAIRLLRHRRRRRRGLCVACGFDIRYSPQRCPECGESTGK